MGKNHTHRNIALYKVFVLMNEPLFWGPVIIMAMQRLGQMKLSDIYLMESVAMALTVLLNIPAGALADVIGRKKVLIIGRIFLLADTILFSTMTSPFEAWAANILWAVGISFQSGADVSFLWRSLKDSGMEKKFIKIDGCANASRFIVAAFCSLAVGYLAEVDLRLPLLLSIPFMVVPLGTAFFLQEPKATERYSVGKQIKTLKQGAIFAIRKSEVWWIIGFCALIMGASKIWFFTYNPYFETVGINLRYYGVIFFLLNIVAFFSSRYAHWIESRFSERSCVAMIILCVGVPIVLMGAFLFWPMALLVLSQNVARGFMKPFVDNFTNRHIEDEGIRTTTLSVRSTLTDLVSVFSLTWFGLMDRSLGLLSSLVVLGVLVLVLGRISYARYSRLFPKS